MIFDYSFFSGEIEIKMKNRKLTVLVSQDGSNYHKNIQVLSEGGFLKSFKILSRAIAFAEKTVREMVAQDEAEYN